MRFSRFAIERVKRFRSMLADLGENDYPFPHSKTAIDLLDESFGELESTLHLASKYNASDEVRRTLAQRTLEDISNKLPILGLIDRSADVAGPVEFHRPFCRIIRRALGDEAKLILASDWSYSPYTYIYPSLFPGHKFVFVGLPYSEAGHVLVLPLAGHELGHNVWYVGEMENEFNTAISESILELISGPFSELYAKAQVGRMPVEVDLFGESPQWLDSLRFSLKQSEELFCDFYGIALFGESYLCAFEYITAPWSFDRVPEYPSMPDRLAAQVQCADVLQISIPAYFKQPGIVAGAEDDIILRLADAATKRQIPRLIERACSLVRETFSIKASKSEVERVAACFRRGRPATGSRSVSDILNAAWSCVSLDGISEVDSSLVNELALKTLEVQEIETIQSEAAECSIQARLLN